MVQPVSDFSTISHAKSVAGPSHVTLRQVIDRNYYPVEEARRSNMRHRPVGLGVQGLADAFLMMILGDEWRGCGKYMEMWYLTGQVVGMWWQMVKIYPDG